MTRAAKAQERARRRHERYALITAQNGATAATRTAGMNILSDRFALAVES